VTGHPASRPLGRLFRFLRQIPADDLGSGCARPLDCREATSAWTGTLRLGVKALVAKDSLVEFGVGYLSLGQKGLDAFEVRLYWSHAF